MIVDLQQYFGTLYADIKRHHHSGSVVIMVAQDVDAACSYRILEDLLICDGIQCQAVPVSGYEDIKRAYMQLVRNSDEVRSVFLVNCGSSAHLGALFAECEKEQQSRGQQSGNDDDDDYIESDHDSDNDDLDDGDVIKRTFYVLDSHRPIHLYNMFDNLSPAHSRHPGHRVVVLGHRDDCSESAIRRVRAIASSGASRIYHEPGASAFGQEDSVTGQGHSASRNATDGSGGHGNDSSGGLQIDNDNKDDGDSNDDDDDDDGHAFGHDEMDFNDDATFNDDLDGFIDYSDEQDVLVFGEDGMPHMRRFGDLDADDDDDNDDFGDDGNPMEFFLPDDPNLDAYRRFFRTHPGERDHYRALIQYYKNERHAIPSALLLYKAITGGSQQSLSMHTSVAGRTAVVLDRERRNKMLWWAIIGMTDHFVNERMTSDDYRRYAKHVANEVLLSNPQQRPEIIMDNGVAIPVTSTNVDQGIMIVERDLRLMLYRHWNLYDSLFHTSFMAARLNTWREQGRENVHYLLANVGIPLDEAQQHWRNMPRKYRDSFVQNLSKLIQGHQPIVGHLKFNPAQLADIFYSTFHKRIGTLELSAEDMVHCVMAIMDSPAEISASDSGTARSKSGVQGENTGEHFMSWRSNFDKALMALGGDTWRIAQGIHNAIHIQRALVQEVSAVMESRARTNNAHFRLTSLVSTARVFDCLPENASSAAAAAAAAGDYSSVMSTGGMDSINSSSTSGAAGGGGGGSSGGGSSSTRQFRQIHLFLSPLALRRLTLFIKETLEYRSTRSSRPLVLSMTDPVRRRVIIVGASNDSARNKFGMAFKLAHERLGSSCQMKHVGFGLSMVELQNPSDESEFLSILAYILDSVATTTTTSSSSSSSSVLVGSNKRRRI